MTLNFQKFKQLHEGKSPFVLPNVWNTKSALIFQEKQFPAVGTSSAAVAESLGYADGENIPFPDYLFIIKRIVSSIQIPLNVDMEMGYGITNDDIYANMSMLVDLGVAGINLEDSMITGSGRILNETKRIAGRIEYIKNKLGNRGQYLFINLRCDTYLLDVANKQNETLNRLNDYEQCGADGIFLPCISTTNDIDEAVHATDLPLNVMCVPGLPGLNELNKLGVKRVSMGPFLFNRMYCSIAQYTDSIAEDGNFSVLFSS
jgi:2-methylisocitrate lyase-like PEP mutase family enzyme